MALRDHLCGFTHFFGDAFLKAVGVGADEYKVIFGKHVFCVQQLIGRAKCRILISLIGDLAVALIEQQEAAIWLLVLEGVVAAHDLAGVATDDKREVVVCERLLDSHLELLESPHDAGVFVHAIVGMLERLHSEHLQVDVSLAHEPVAARKPLGSVHAARVTLRGGEGETNDANALNSCVEHFDGF